MSIYKQLESLTPEEIIFLTDILERSVERNILFEKQISLIEEVIGEKTEPKLVEEFNKEFNMLKDVHAKFKLIKEVVT